MITVSSTVWWVHMRQDGGGKLAMSAGTAAAWARIMRWRVMAATLVAATGLSLTGPASATTRATPTATTVYVANYLSGAITPINTATDTAGPPISVIGQPYMLAATPDGRTIYVVSVDNRPAPP